MDKRIEIKDIDLRDKFLGKFTFENLGDFNPKHLFELPFSRVVSTYEMEGEPLHTQEYVINDNTIEYIIKDGDRIDIRKYVYDENKILKEVYASGNHSDIIGLTQVNKIRRKNKVILINPNSTTEVELFADGNTAIISKTINDEERMDVFTYNPNNRTARLTAYTKYHRTIEKEDHIDIYETSYNEYFQEIWNITDCGKFLETISYDGRTGLPISRCKMEYNGAINFKDRSMSYTAYSEMRIENILDGDILITKGIETINRNKRTEEVKYHKFGDFYYHVHSDFKFIKDGKEVHNTVTLEYYDKDGNKRL